MTFTPRPRRVGTGKTPTSLTVNNESGNPEVGRIIDATRAYAEMNGFTQQSVILAALDEYLERQAKSLKVVRA